MDELLRESIYNDLRNSGADLRRLDRERRSRLKSICGTCQYAQIMRRDGREEYTVLCGAQERAITVPTDLSECSKYDRRNSDSLREMTERAVLIDLRHGVDSRSYL